jgi:hypothetical protein
LLGSKITSAELLYTDMQVISPHHEPLPPKKGEGWEFISKIPDAAAQPFPYYWVMESFSLRVKQQGLRMTGAVPP